MPTNYILLEKIVVGAAGASSVTFSGIPQTGYTDLKIVASTRGDRSATNAEFFVKFNTSSANFTYKLLQGNSSTAGTYSGSTGLAGVSDAATNTANTFANSEIYIPNYTSANYKSFSIESLEEENSAATTYMYMIGGLWSNTAAITTIELYPESSTNWSQYSTFYLYGVAALGTTPLISPYATGGDTIMTDGTYWYHAFKASGTFTPVSTLPGALSCDVLVVAGGGSGGWPYAGGGGAGGVIAFAAQSISTAQTVTVGAGGAGAYNSGNGAQGSNSVFGSLTAAVGGGRAAGGAGGSGGGGSAYSRDAANNAGGTATSGQGNAGGIGSPSSYTNEGGGGGGGAGSVGGAATGVNSGAGGAGTNSVTNWGALSAALTATGLGVSGYIAGGGGGGSNGAAVNAGAAGSGGGGRGASNDFTQESQAGTANTGGGSGGGAAGGAPASPKSGGSGLVIVRYAV